MVKRIFWAILLLCMVCVGHALAAERKGDCLYEPYDEDTAILVEYVGEASSLDIPRKLDGYTLIGIEAEAFAGNETLRQITLPDSILGIGERAFAGCTELREVTLPSSLELMGEWAFAECLQLNRVRFTPGIQEIGEGAFYGCPKLISVSLPGSVRRIGRDAFSDCTGLSHLVLNRGLESIESNAFNGCAALEQVDIPDTVTFLGYYAFANCSSLTRVSLPASIREVESTDYKDDPFWRCPGVSLEVQQGTFAYEVFTGEGMPYEKIGNRRLVRHDDWAFLDYLILAEYEDGTTDVCILEYMGWEEDYTIPEAMFGSYRVVAIEDGSFANCERLRSLTIPSYVVQFGGDFLGGRTDIVVYVEAGSRAEQFCKGNGIAYGYVP